MWGGGGVDVGRRCGVRKCGSHVGEGGDVGVAMWDVGEGVWSVEGKGVER